jgi:hypothetical protein
VKILWQTDKPVDLLDFYYPCRVQIASESRMVHHITEIQATGSFVIQGIIGQGKSIFLRYLCVQELARQQRFPVFLELRRYSPRKDFAEFLAAGLASYALPTDPETFEYLASTGKLVLLLDGFDEVQFDEVTRVVSEIESLLRRFPSLQTVVVSRPYSGIELSPLFRVYKLAPLVGADHEAFLRKIVPNEIKVLRGVLNAISQSSTEVQNLLSTPLLMSLLVIMYRETMDVPSTLADFYEVLFPTLLWRHDAQKAGFHRDRASKLNNTELQRLFDAFCYAARQSAPPVLSHSKLEDTLHKGSRLTGLRCAPEDFVKDITGVVCLMQRVGNDQGEQGHIEYEFIHESVADFHAASFIAHASDDTARKFYEKVRGGSWVRWHRELAFLQKIDRIRYLRFHFVPASLAALQSYGVGPEEVGQPIQLSAAVCATRLNDYEIRVAPPPELDPHPRELPGPSFVVQWDRTSREPTELSYMEGLIDVIRTFLLTAEAKELPGRKLGDMISEWNLLEEAARVMTNGARDLAERLAAALRELEREDRVTDFVDP